MKCIVIHGSQRRGNTYRITNALIEEMEALGHYSFEEVFLKDLDMEFCLGCNSCFLKGEAYCPHRESIQALAEKIEEADTLIVTSPVYSLGPSALVKCWIDHMSYRFHRPLFFSKKALVIATTAGAGATKTAGFIRDTLMHWGFNWVGQLAVECRSLNYQIDEKVQKKLKNTAKSFHKELTVKTLRKPSFKRVIYYNVWRAMAEAGKSEKNADYCYWQKENLFNTSFAPSVHIGFFKNALGNMVYSSFKRLIK